MAKRYFIGKLPDIQRGDSFPSISIVSDASLSGWTLSASIVQWLGLITRRTLAVTDVSLTEKRINSFAGDLGPGSYGFRLAFTSPSGFKTTTFEGSFNIVKTNKEINTNESGVSLNVEILPDQNIQINVSLTGGGSGPSGPVEWDDVLNKPDFSDVATSGSYNDLNNRPNLFDGSYNSLEDKPDLFSGDYEDLYNKPELFDGNYNSLDGRPALSEVATTGNYNDLSNKPDDLINETQLQQALSIPAMFFGPTLAVTKWLKPDGITETTEDDPEARPQIDVAGEPPEVLPTPEFGTATIASTGYSLPVTNKPTGALIVWTDNGDTQPGNDTPLVLTGGTPESVHDITAKFTKTGSVDSDVAETQITLNPDSGYEVVRRWYINTRHNFGSDASDPKWNNITLDESATTQDLTPQLGTGNINMIANVAFSGSEGSLGATGGLYEDAVINTSWNYNGGSGCSITLSNLDDTKYYQIYVGTWAVNNNTQVAIINADGEQKSKSNYQTWGVNGENEFESNFYTQFNNKQSATGVIDIIFDCSGFYQNRLQAIIIEESDVQKP